MDFELTDDQVALQEGVRSFLQGRFPIEAVRALEPTGGVDRALWQELADLGVFALRLPEADGGVGLGWADAVLVFEELGRAVVPGPLVWTHLAAGLVPGAATGECIVGGIERGDASRFVEHPGALDVLLVVDDDGVWSVDATTLAFDPVGTPLDSLTPAGRIVGDLPQGERVLDADGAASLRLQGAALVAGFLLGLAQATTDLAVAYSRERVQFDRPIGTFQSLKHLMADMLVRSEVARGGVYAAGVTLDDPHVGSIARAVASAKYTAGDAAIENAKTSVQVHGGMGYTWEIDAHLHLKRAYALEPCFGSRDHHAEVMADLLDEAVGA
jgi:alkylation response protein AidB-like acyl-CoA dehydrogenase